MDPLQFYSYAKSAHHSVLSNPSFSSYADPLLFQSLRILEELDVPHDDNASSSFYDAHGQRYKRLYSSLSPAKSRHKPSNSSPTSGFHKRLARWGRSDEAI